MKKIILTFSLVLILSLSILLTACGGNAMTDGNGDTNNPSSTATEKATDNIIDDAESKIEDMSEDATHGVEDGTPGGHSSRGGSRTLIPRGK